MLAGLTTLSSVDSESFSRQIIWVLLASIIIFSLPFFNLKAIFSYKSAIFGIYLLSIIFLLSTLFFAPRIHGTREWLFISDFQIQPSEFIKVALVLLLSTFFASRHIAIARFGTIIKSFIYLSLPLAIILLQPDLGTALVIFSLWFSYLLFSEIPKKFLIRFLIAFIGVAFIMWNFGLAPYQKSRIVGFLNPNTDPLGANYNVIQSKIAIGSGGLFGKGFHQGTQVQLNFLPAAKNDFIFSSFVEEWGVFGGAVLVSIYMFLIYRILKVGEKSDNNFSRYVALGTVTILLIHFIANVGSAIGFLPVVGLNLPFVSYGGSNLLTMAILIGIILNTAERRAGF